MFAIRQPLLPDFFPVRRTAVISDEEFTDLPAHEPAWAALDRIAAYRKQLLAAGYSVVPVNGKRVHLDDWPNIRATPAMIDTWAITRADHLSTGVLCRDTPFADIDVTDEEVAEEIEALFENAIENSAVRIGLPPKRAIPFQTDAPFKKIATQFRAPNGLTHKVEVLADGQQIVVDGTHPETQKPYRWHGGEPGPKLRREDLPLITAESAAAFIAAAANVMRRHGWQEVKSKEPNSATNVAEAPVIGAGHTMRERAYATAALDACCDELTSTTEGDRNNNLYKKSFRLGTMAARGWITREEIEAALYDAAIGCGLVRDDGDAQTRRTIKSGLDEGTNAPHPSLSDETNNFANVKNYPSAPKLLSRNAASINPEKVNWLWVGRLARGKHCCIAGEPGTGKSQVSISITAAVTTAGQWPCDEGTAPLGSVIILSAEDGAADTIVPRLMAAGADRKRVQIVYAVRTPDGKGQRGFNLQTDIVLLEEKIAEVGDVALVIIDPVSSYLGKTDSHKNAEVRGVLEPLSEMAERMRVAVLSITHFNKTGNSFRAMHRFIGSIAFTGAPRTAFAVMEEPDDIDHKFFLHAKNNLAAPPQGLGFRLEQCIVAEGVVASRVVWDLAPVTITASQALAAEAEGSDQRNAMAEAQEFLQGALANEPLAAKDVQDMAREHGISQKTLRTAREKMKVKITRDGFGHGSKSLWSLPPYLPKNPIDAHSPERASMGSEGKYGEPEVSSDHRTRAR
jgi:hypothetical protein